MEIYGGHMKRFVLFFTLVFTLFLLITMRYEYLNIVSKAKEQLHSNGKYATDLTCIDGKVVEFNLSSKTMIFSVKTLEGKSKNLKLLIKYKDEDFIQSLIENQTFHLALEIDMNQHQFTSAKNRFYFDYDQYLFSNGITGQYYLKEILEVKKCRPLCLSCFRLEIRTWIQNYLTKSFEPTKSGFLLALILGDKSEFEGYELYKNLGLAHVFAISGLHFGIIYQYFRQILFIKNRFVKSSIIIATMAFMLLLVGGAYSAQRAFFMILYSEVANMLHRKHDIFINMAVSLLLILLLQPEAILSTGLHLSYFAYMCVAVFYKSIFKRKLKSKILEAFRFSVAIQLLLLPATLYYFQSANLFGFVSNAIIVPLSGIILPLSLIFLIFGALNLNILTGILRIILTFLIGAFEWIGSWLPLELDYFIHFKKSDFYLLLVYLFILSLFLISWHLFQKKQKTHLFTCVIISLLFITFNYRSNGEVNITFYDVGHGDMSLIETGQLNVLIDTGDGRVDSNALLRGQGIHHIDILVLSHAHNDHIGDVVSLITNMRVDRIFANQATIDALALDSPGIEKQIILLNKPLELILKEDLKNPVIFSIFPMTNKNVSYSGNLNEESYDPNEDALVCSLNYGETNGWFLGDISGEVIDLNFKQDIKQIDFIKSAHHGSKTSMSSTFYASHQLKYAFTSCNTKYKMPYSAFEQILDTNQIEHYTTYRYGEIGLSITENTMKIKSFLNP